MPLCTSEAPSWICYDLTSPLLLATERADFGDILTGLSGTTGLLSHREAV